VTLALPQVFLQHEEPAGAPLVGGHSGPGLGFGPAGLPQGRLGGGPRGHRLALFPLGDLRRGLGSTQPLGELLDAGVQLSHPLLGLPAACLSLLPVRLSGVALRVQCPEPGRGYPARQVRRLGAIGLVLGRRLGLLLERPELALQLRHHVLKPEEVLLQRRQLPLGSLLATAVLGYPRGFLDEPAALLRPGQEDVLEVALADHGV
jgi:hypothetical protein